MNTQEFLLDLHERSHRSFAGLLEHCRQFSDEELNQEIEEYGIPTLRLQLHHMIEAERYWLGVIEGRIDVDDNADSYPTVASLEKYREEVFELTQTHIKKSSDQELDTGRMMTTWQKKEVMLAPVHVITRTHVHIYQHQGQVIAMCRRFGKPSSGHDYPIK